MVGGKGFWNPRSNRGRPRVTKEVCTRSETVKTEEGTSGGNGAEKKRTRSGGGLGDGVRVKSPRPKSSLFVKLGEQKHARMKKGVPKRVGKERP